MQTGHTHAAGTDMEPTPPDPSPDPTPFSPAPSVEFRPDDQSNDLADAAPTSPVEPGDPERPGTQSTPLFETTAFAPGGFGPDEGPGLGFAANGRAAASSFAAHGREGSNDYRAAEVHQSQPLWSTQANEESVLSGGGARDNGWFVVTAVLVAIFVAVTVGYTVLSEDSGSNRASVEEAPLTRPDGGSGSDAAASATTAPATTEVPTTTAATVPVAEWGTVIADDRSFRAEMPGSPNAVSANLAGTAAASYSVDSGDHTFRVLTSPFTSQSDAATDDALATAASGAVPETVIEGTSPTAYPGGVRVYDFRATTGDRTVLGRALAASGHLYVLTMTVPSDATESPEVLTDLVRFRNGFVPLP